MGRLSVLSLVFAGVGCSSNEVVQKPVPATKSLVKVLPKTLPNKSSLDSTFKKASLAQYKAKQKIQPAKRIAKVRPQPKRVARARPEPKRVVKARLQPRRVIRARPQPQRIVRARPQPQRIVRARPQPQRIVRARPQPQRIVRARPQPRPQYKPAVRKPVARVAKRASQRRNLPAFLPKTINYPKSNSLRGDFSGNLATIAFINKMTQRHGFDRRYLNYLFSNTKATTFLKKMAYNDSKPKKRRKTKSRKGSWSRYRNLFLTSKTIDKGVAFWRQNKAVFEQAERRYGVPQEYILGIIGVETRYGGNVGQNRAIDALATMGFRNARRGKYFQSELESFLLMARRTGLNPLSAKASYAGALGLCQFMPSNIKRYGVDMDRKGGCNLWTPADAIGSVANYFSKHGWRKGGDVAVLASTKGRKHKKYPHSYKTVHNLSRVKQAGIRPLGPISSKVRVLRMNTYDGEEVWLADHNFYVITRYNHSSKYAMAVHQLAQAIKRRIKPNYRTASL